MRVVTNADDFGASDDTVRATIACFERGALTSATIMTAMPATPAALEYAAGRGDVSFGVHLALVGDGRERPLSDPARVPSLVDDDGVLLPTNVVRRRALTGRLRVEEICLEIERQLEVARDAGVSLTHVDSHRHVHKLGPVRDALARVLPRFGVHRVRRVQDVYLRRPVTSPTYWVGRVWQAGLARRFVSTDHFYMPSSAHDAGWAAPLLDRMDGLPGVTLEVGVHPGEVDEWRVEEGASVIELAEGARERGHELVGWSDV